MKSRSGFTIVELLVAMVVSMTVVAMILSLSANITGKFNGMRERLETQAAARFTLDKVARDLEQAVAMAAPSEWMVLRSGTSNYGGLPADELMFYTAVEDADATGSQGQVSAVYYSLQYQGLAAKADKPFFGLYRAGIDAERTFQKAVGSASLAALWDDGGEFHDEGTVRTNLLAQNVVGFQITLNFRHLDGTFESLQAPLRLGAGWTGSWTAAGDPARRLVSAEIHLTFLSKQGAGMLQTGVPPQEIVKQYGYTYSRLVSIQAQPELWVIP